MKYFINCSHYRTITVTTSLLRGSVAKNKNEDRRKGRIETLLGFSFGKWWWWMVIFCVFFVILGVRPGAEDRRGDSHPRGHDEAAGRLSAPESGPRGGQDAARLQRAHDRLHQRAAGQSYYLSLTGVATPQSWGHDPHGCWWPRVRFGDRSDVVP